MMGYIASLSEKHLRRGKTVSNRRRYTGWVIQKAEVYVLHKYIKSEKVFRRSFLWRGTDLINWNNDHKREGIQETSCTLKTNSLRDHVYQPFFLKNLSFFQFKNTLYINCKFHNSTPRNTALLNIFTYNSSITIWRKCRFYKIANFSWIIFQIEWFSVKNDRKKWKTHCAWIFFSNVFWGSLLK